MNRNSMERLLSGMASDFVYKYGPCELNQLIFALETTGQLLDKGFELDDEILYWALFKLIKSQKIFTKEPFVLKDPHSLRNMENVLNRSEAFRYSRGHSMCIWSLLYTAQDVRNSGEWKHFVVERPPTNNVLPAKTFVALAARPRMEDGRSGTDSQNHFIFNGETAFFGKLKVELTALGAVDSDSHIIIASDNRKVFEVIPPMNNKMTAYLFQSLPRTGVPHVEIYRRNKK